MAKNPQRKHKVKTEQQIRQERLLIELRKKQKAAELAAAMDDVRDDDVDIPDPELELEPEIPEPSTKELLEQVEALQKDYGMTAMSMPDDVPAGPTSFDELDAARAAQEQASELSEASYDAQSLVRNILNHPMMEPKAKAAAIKEVGTGFEKRVTDILAAPAEPVEKDLDLLSVESILAYNNRHTNLVEQLIDKAKVSYASRQDMPDENFALVTERGGKKIRKYLIHDKSHVRNALARAAQEMAAGGEAAADAKAAMPKIRAAAKKFGVEMSMAKEKNAIIVEKDKTGSWRWIGWVSNNFQDTDGDIISKEAHEKYVAFLDAHPEMAPAFITWHTPGTMRKSLPDFWAFENGFLIMSGPLTEPEAEKLIKAGSTIDLGMSHGTFVLRRDPNDSRVVTDYLTYEVSDLPRENAANPFTAIETMAKEANNMNKLDFLAQYVGEDRAKELMAQTEQAQKALQDQGVMSKSTDKPDDAPATLAPAAAPAADAPDPKLIEQIMKELDIPGLNAFVVKAQEAMEKVALLETVIKDLKTGQDDKLAEMINPPAAKLAWSQRATANDKNVVTDPENERLLKNKAGLGADYWLSEATGTQPVAQP